MKKQKLSKKESSKRGGTSSGAFDTQIVKASAYPQFGLTLNLFGKVS